jgi:hypothetical protein
MSAENPTLEELEAMELELALKLSFVKQQREKIIKETELSRPQVIHVVYFANETIKFETNGIPRNDVLELLRITPSRYYNYATKQNEINIKDWGEFYNKFKDLPNTEVTFKDTLETDIESFINEPLLSVVYGNKDIEINLAKRSRDWYIFDKIPGKTILHKEGKSTVHVPYSEAWRLGQVLQSYEDLEIDSKTKELISKQTEARIKLDTLAQQTDCDLEVDMNGHTLRPFQKVGVKFALLALGEIE